jgi:hypothetical protein
MKEWSGFDNSIRFQLPQLNNNKQYFARMKKILMSKPALCRPVATEPSYNTVFNCFCHSNPSWGIYYWAGPYMHMNHYMGHKEFVGRGRSHNTTTVIYTHTTKVLLYIHIIEKMGCCCFYACSSSRGSTNYLTDICILIDTSRRIWFSAISCCCMFRLLFWNQAYLCKYHTAGMALYCVFFACQICI